MGDVSDIIITDRGSTVRAISLLGNKTWWPSFYDVNNVNLHV